MRELYRVTLNTPQGLACQKLCKFLAHYTPAGGDTDSPNSAPLQGSPLLNPSHFA